MKCHREAAVNKNDSRPSSRWHSLIVVVVAVVTWRVLFDGIKCQPFLYKFDECRHSFLHELDRLRFICAAGQVCKNELWDLSDTYRLE